MPRGHVHSKTSDIENIEINLHYVKPEHHEIGKMISEDGLPCYDLERTICDYFKNHSRLFQKIFSKHNNRRSGIVFRNITYTSSELSKIATRQNFDGFKEEFNAFIYRLLRFFFPMCEENFSHLIPGNNDIEVKLENVVANGRKINLFNLKSNVETKGNENISF